MKKLLITISVLFIVLGAGGWFLLQNYLNKEKQKYAIENKRRQIELNETTKNFNKQVEQEKDWKPLGGSQGGTTSSTSTGTRNGSRKFLGRSQTGYELWADSNCVYVVGVTEADLARLNTDVWGFKKEIKSQTGYKCVLYE